MCNQLPYLLKKGLLDDTSVAKNVVNGGISVVCNAMAIDPTNDDVGGIANERAIGVTNEWASSIIEGDLTSMLLMLFCLEIHELELFALRFVNFFPPITNKD
jgi:hypothetical protein